MASGDEDSRDSAPDLKILGDSITLQPSGYVEPPSSAREEALMKHMASFRSEPLQYVLCISGCPRGKRSRASDPCVSSVIARC